MQPKHQAVLQSCVLFARNLGLSGQAERFALGAGNIGYSCRQAEEELYPAARGAIPLLTARLIEIWQDESFDDRTVVTLLAMRYAGQMDWHGEPLSVRQLPGQPGEHREEDMHVSLNRLTNAGAEFTSKPVEISDEQVVQCWRFGFAWRSAEASLPRIAGRTYNALLPSAEI